MSSHGNVDDSIIDDNGGHDKSSTSGLEQPPHTSWDHDTGYTLPGTAADGLDGPDRPRDDDVLSEGATTKTVRSTASTARSQASGSVFSKHPGSDRSNITPPEDGPRNSQPAVGLGPAQTQTLDTVSPGQTLWCEFRGLLGCDAIFRLDNEAEWIEHHVDHLQDTFPEKLMCWFCDDFHFDAARPAEAFANFVVRMQHVRQHIFDYDSPRVRPDFHLVVHLYQNGTLDEARYEQAMSKTEVPPELRLPGGDSTSSLSSRQPRNERDEMLAHDLQKEERRRRREMERSRRGRYGVGRLGCVSR
ncbi:hypothetical protein VTH06DRAFT_1083 [Thermothelomyces fergusii]